MALIVDDSGTTRFEGTITGPGITMPSCMLLTVATDIHAIGIAPFLWIGLKDNAFDFNALTAIPAGLGLSFLFNGTDATITMTESGTWAFSLTVNYAPVPDATWDGYVLLDDTTVAAVGGVPGAAEPRLSVSEIVTYPAGATFVPSVVTAAAATSNPLDASANLTIVRLG